MAAAEGEVAEPGRRGGRGAAGTGRLPPGQAGRGGAAGGGFRRLGERRGPGAGRPAKLYRRASAEVAASLPPRTYETAAHLLAEAVEQSGADQVLQAAARRAGQEAGRRELTAAGGPGIERVLAARGYEPYRDGPSLRLRNCPFANLAGEYPVLVCAMNLDLIEGLLEGIGEPAGRAAMAGRPLLCGGERPGRRRLLKAIGIDIERGPWLAEVMAARLAQVNVATLRAPLDGPERPGSWPSWSRSTPWPTRAPGSSGGSRPRTVTPPPSGPSTTTG